MYVSPRIALVQLIVIWHIAWLVRFIIKRQSKLLKIHLQSVKTFFSCIVKTTENAGV